MISYSRVKSEKHLREILSLQSSNLKRNMGVEDIASQGFVTAEHTFEQLKLINDIENTPVAIFENKVVAYAIAMTKEAAAFMSIFDGLLEETEKIIFNNDRLKNYIFVGQLCVHKDFRGIGVVPSLYNFFASELKAEYKYGITDLSSNNPRSLKAHQNSGFEMVKTFFDINTNEDWHIVLKDLRK